MRATITPIEVLAYGRILKVLYKAEASGCLTKEIEKWTEKARWINQNPKSIKYMVEMSKEEIKREISKMEGVIKIEEEKEEAKLLESKKRRQSEEPEKKEIKKEINIEDLTHQIEEHGH